MARDSEVKPSTMGKSDANTGHDGAIDFVSKAELLDRSIEAGEANADDHIYRVIELVGTSQSGIEDAVKSAIAGA
jgi:hypothetical protein